MEEVADLSNRRLAKRNMCDGKRKHKSANCARKEIERIKSDITHITPYRCFYCGRWHVGHTIKE
jgi:hypothetical protein